MVFYEQANDWLPYGMYMAGAMFSGVAALLCCFHRLWGTATFFTLVMAISVAALLLQGM